MGLNFEKTAEPGLRPVRGTALRRFAQARAGNQAFLQEARLTPAEHAAAIACAVASGWLESRHRPRLKVSRWRSSVAVFSRSRRFQEVETYSASVLMTMAQAGMALERSNPRQGHVARHFGQMVLGVLEQSSELGRGTRRQVRDLIALEMGLDLKSKLWQLYAQWRVDPAVAGELAAELHTLSSESRSDALKAMMIPIGALYGFDATREELPGPIDFNCHHAALTLVTVCEDTRHSGDVEQATRRFLASLYESQLLMLWRVMERESVRIGNSLSYTPRLDQP